MNYELIRSSRKSLAVSVKDGRVIVRAPRRVSRAYIESFLTQHQEWIAKRLRAGEEANEKAERAGTLTAEELLSLRREAGKVIPERVAHFAPLVGTDYGKITIRCQKTKWGSCTAAGNLSFNCLLMLAPPEVLDSVVVHELCHRLEMNHSRRFYEEVLRVYPEYRRWNGWLKENGAVLMKRVQG